MGNPLPKSGKTITYAEPGNDYEIIQSAFTKLRFIELVPRAGFGSFVYLEPFERMDGA